MHFLSRYASLVTLITCATAAPLAIESRLNSSQSMSTTPGAVLPTGTLTSLAQTPSAPAFIVAVNSVSYTMEKDIAEPLKIIMGAMDISLSSAVPTSLPNITVAVASTDSTSTELTLSSMAGSALPSSLSAHSIPDAVIATTDTPFTTITTPTTSVTPTITPLARRYNGFNPVQGIIDALKAKTTIAVAQDDVDEEHANIMTQTSSAAASTSSSSSSTQPVASSPTPSVSAMDALRVATQNLIAAEAALINVMAAMQGEQAMVPNAADGASATVPAPTSTAMADDTVESTSEAPSATTSANSPEITIPKEAEQEIMDTI